MYAALLAVSAFILISGAAVLRNAFDWRYGRVNYLLFSIGFTALYVGGGGVWSLLTMPVEAYEWALGYYEITTEGVALVAIVWGSVLLALAIASRMVSSSLSFGEIWSGLQSTNSGSLGLRIVAVVITGALLVGYASGTLGYMGQKVGTEESAYEMSPIADTVVRLYPAIAALFGSRLFDRTVRVKSALFGLAMLGLLAPLGRRVFLAAVITAMILSYLGDRSFTPTRLIRLGAVAFVATIGLAFFFNLRIASYARSDETGEAKVELQSLLPDALALTFGQRDLATQESASLQADNAATRPFFTYGFLIYCAQGYAISLGNHGLLSLAGMAVAIPRTLLPSKDRIITDYGEEERFVERDFGIPVTTDESPTLPASGLINAGLPGVWLQVFLLAGTLFLSVTALSYIKTSPFALIGAVYLLYSLQLAETGTAEMFVRLRFIVILTLLGLLWSSFVSVSSGHANKT